MPDYRPPYRDMQFVLNELLDSDSHYQSLKGCEQVTPDLLDAIMGEAGKFAVDVIAPLNLSGDEQGCKFDNGAVTVPAGFGDAFKQFGENGWQALNIPVEDGGQGLPNSIGMMVNEMTGAANWAWSMYCGLAHAPVTCLMAAGTEAQKAQWIPKILTGEWAGTMCLTESHCGSDVGLLRTKAVANGDGTYQLTGTKIFISGGEQDMTDNIIHSVLARVEGAPEGTKGISLFIVPKVMVNDDGSLGEANSVSCGSIEKKMGLKGSATCVMNFDAATAYLVGEENKGLDIMFNMMNTARIGTGLQGLAMGEASFQGALAYANDRLQMRSLTGPKNTEGNADPIIVHPDVRRMLMTQKAFVEGSRALVYWLAQLVDQTKYGTNEETVKDAEATLDLLTPVVKAFCTEISQEVTNLGVQVYGGHGYISEHGMEQLVRDGRISTVYEGTTGIQALDLLGRKVMGSGGEVLRTLTKKIHKYCESQKDNEAMAEFIAPLAAINKQWGELTMEIGGKLGDDLEELGAASVDFTMFSGYATFAYLWAQMAEAALAKQDQDKFYQAKVVTAKFYFQRLLPRAQAHAAAASAGASTLMELDADSFAL